MIPLLGRSAVVELQGAPAGLFARTETGHAETFDPGIPLAVAGEGDDPFALVERLMDHAVRALGTCRRRDAKPVPPWTRSLGWCSWNAFQHEVSEEGVRAAIAGFEALGLPLGFMILDAGWQDADSEGRMRSFGANGRFPRGLAPLIAEARSRLGLRWFGVWHTLLGFWKGVDPGSDIGREHGALPNGLVHPDGAARFYAAWYGAMKRDGVDFTKVDNQGATAGFLRPHFGHASGYLALRRAFEAAESAAFGGAAINCMAQETAVLYQLERTTVLRNSDDYYPDREPNPEEHVLQNAFNALWTRTIALPDWDMFQSHHARAWWHAAARAVSGGPVYVTDDPGRHDADLLRSLILPDGAIPPLDGFAVPARRCLFSDPRTGEPLVVWNRAGPAALLALFNMRSEAATASVGPGDAEFRGDGAPQAYAIWSRRHGFAGVAGIDDRVDLALPPREWDIVVVAPAHHETAVIGQPEAFNPPGWIAGTHWSEEGGRRTLTVSMRARGPLLVASLHAPVSVAEKEEGVPIPFDMEGRLIRIRLERAPGPVAVRVAF